MPSGRTSPHGGAREAGLGTVGVMRVTPVSQRVGVRLAADEWSVVLEALRRFALEYDEVGRPDRARIAQRAVSKLVLYRVAAGAAALDDDPADALDEEPVIEAAD